MFSHSPSVISIFQTFEEVEQRQWECMENEWEKEKKKILNSLLGSGQESLELQQDLGVRNQNGNQMK